MPPATSGELGDDQTRFGTRVRTEPRETPAEPDVRRREGDQGKRRKDGGGFFRELPFLLLVAFLLALLVKTFLIQAFFIPSSSMEPTLDIGDRVLVNKVVYRLHPPRRGDVIVFEDPHPSPESDRNPVSAFVQWVVEGLGASTSAQKDFIKRVIALPGETIEIKRGAVIVNGKKIREPYLNSPRDLRDYGPHRVPPNNVFVMGDNRNNSNDSRGTLGDIPQDKVVGRAFVTIWPPSRIGWLSRD